MPAPAGANRTLAPFQAVAALRLPRSRAGQEPVGTLRVDDVRSRVDGARTSKLLLEAAKRLAMWDPSRQSASAEVRAGARLVAEAEAALARFRRLDELQKRLVEVTALTEAGVEPEEIEAK